MDQLHNPVPHPAAQKSTVNSVLARVSSVGNKLISLLSGLLAACLILYSGYVLYDTFYTQTNAGNSWELLQYRPEILDDGATPLSGSLVSINQDYRAWVTLYNTNIDYPVMQGENDLYYASHDVYGQPSLTGSVYLAAGNLRNMANTYNIIYGHHMDNGAMFGALDSFRSQGYINGHREGVVISTSGVYDLTVFAVIDTDAYESQIYSVGDRKDDVIAFLRSPAANTTVHYFDAAVADSAERIVAFSTCADAATNGRLVVFAKMTKRDLVTLDGTGYGDVYDGRPHGLSNVETNYPDDAVIEYSTDGGNTWTTTPPTLTNVGTLNVIVRVTSEEYGTTEMNLVIQVRPAPVTVTVHDATKRAGEDDPAFTATVTGLIDDFAPEYEIRRPGAGSDEDAGNYEGALIAEGEELQGNYIITYVPGNFTITEPATAIIEDVNPPLSFYFTPTGGSVRGGCWALVNLICLLVTIYLFIPITHLRDKFGRAETMRKYDEKKKELRELIELREKERWERERIKQEVQKSAEAEAAEIGETVGEVELTEENFAEAVETLYYQVKKFLRRFRTGIGLELVDAIVATVVFILTESMREPMVLIDRWTPLMILLLTICWTIDVRLVRYRSKVLIEEEEKELERLQREAAQVGV